MSSVSASRRLSAIVSFASSAGAVVVAGLGLVRRPLLLLVTMACFSVAIWAGSYAVTRTGGKRTSATVVASSIFLAPVVLWVTFADALAPILVVVLGAIAAGTARLALGRDVRTLKAEPTPGVKVGPALRPVLIMNPRSGGGKVERFGLVKEARRLGFDSIVLQPGDELAALANDAVARGGDVVGMAGGDGSQAVVAAAAMQHGISHVCVPAGTRNHLAMDLGLDREDVLGALDAFGSAVMRRIDLGRVGERVFVNNATMGLYAKIVQSPEYRDKKARTALEMLPEMLGPHTEPFDLRFTGPDGMHIRSAHLILVSNNRYELQRPEGFGSRRTIEAGKLGIIAATFRNSNEVARFIQMYLAGRARQFPGWLEWTATHFEVHSGGPVEIGIDGEALVLDPPLRFEVLPGALQVRIPSTAPGYSPAASTPWPSLATVEALLQTARGRRVAIEAPAAR